MAKNKMLSVVMPTFNREWCISDAIRSVRGQNYYKWELIVVDDGSTDHTNEVMAFWSGFDDRIKYIRRTENLGIAASRNEGIERATGDIIVVMDSDDIMLKDRLFDIELAFQNDMYDVTYTDYYRGDHLGNPIQLIKAQDFSDDLLDGKQAIPHVTIAVSTEMARKVPYQNDKRINDDWFWLVDLYNAGARFRYIPEKPSMIVREFESGVSHQNREQYDKDFQEYKINKELRQQHEKNT